MISLNVSTIKSAGAHPKKNETKHLVTIWFLQSNQHDKECPFAFHFVPLLSRQTSL